MTKHDLDFHFEVPQPGLERHLISIAMSCHAPRVLSSDENVLENEDACEQVEELNDGKRRQEEDTIPSIVHGDSNDKISRRNPTDNIDQIMQRAKRVKEKCGIYRNEMRVEGQALHYTKDTINKCTNINFDVNEKDFSICNVLKGGSLSWKQFFLHYKIPFTFLAYVVLSLRATRLRNS